MEFEAVLTPWMVRKLPLIPHLKRSGGARVDRHHRSSDILSQQLVALRSADANEVSEQSPCHTRENISP